MRVLGIESSCDETGIAVYEAGFGLRAHCIYSQANMHSEYGGVVPELASRDHVRKILPLIQQTLCEANVDKKSLDGVAFTAGPGLVGALMVGASVARSFAWALGVPALGINHLEGHLLAPMFEKEPPDFPFLCLLVSGGHTQIVLVKEIGRYSLLGESIDDAVGEAFDKTAQLLKLGYPGGPALANIAERGDSERYRFPRPMLNREGFDFSFSGLKTSVITAYKKLPDEQMEQEKSHIARGFEEAVVETLVTKTQRALEAAQVDRLVVAGGVAANKRLRAAMIRMADMSRINVFFPRFEFCSDNGAMIALAGCLRLMAGQSDTLEIRTSARWPLLSLQPLA
ncbi:MAG: tRNA (adenosine(37)-N6)-threonylcarbamoyltransferase complex transferase subunit TsaD [Gammaproteobacteria bacterium]|nr:tRNA (adenosine(37)-N6)-threonylcarbamoyltransferase complex transferase subunit TsaD [Gammaproteobacteria bacterium]